LKPTNVFFSRKFRNRAHLQGTRDGSACNEAMSQQPGLHVGYSRCNHGNGSAGGVAGRAIWDESDMDWIQPRATSPRRHHTGSTWAADITVKFNSVYFTQLL